MATRVIVGLMAMLIASPACAPGRGELTVYAASSLGEAFADLAESFEGEHGATVTLNAGASSALSRQIAEGAPADVFAAADASSLEALGPRIVSARTFARNRLAIAVADGNPARIRGLADLGRPGAVVVLCDEEVPCGRYAGRALRAAGVEVRPASREPNVRAVLARVGLGEADAGIVYESDLEGRDAPEGLQIPPHHNVEADYRIGVVRGTGRERLAAAFVALVTSGSGERTLARHGFRTN